MTAKALRQVGQMVFGDLLEQSVGEVPVLRAAHVSGALFEDRIAELARDLTPEFGRKPVALLGGRGDPQVESRQVGAGAAGTAERLPVRARAELLAGLRAAASQEASPLDVELGLVASVLRP